MIKNFEGVVGLFEKIHPFLMKIRYNKEIKDKQHKKITQNYILSKKEKDQVDKYFLENYGKKVGYEYHQMYSVFHEGFKEYYIPEYVYRADFEPLMNPTLHRKVLGDKNLLGLLCRDIDRARIPKTYASCSMGRYQNEKKEFLSKEAFIDYISNIGEFICKPTIDSGSGRNVRLYNLEKGIDKKTGKSAKEIVEEYGKNFVIQEKIESHDVLKTLYPNSINTFRVISYIFENKIYHCPIALRMGSGGSYLDNANAGGLFAYVSDDGDLGEYAFFEKENKKFKAHPDTNVTFLGYNIPQTKDIIRVSEEIHRSLPQLGTISFDFSIDKDSNIVIIEINLDGAGLQIPQIATDQPVFGENTSKILQWIKNQKNSSKKRGHYENI